MSEVQTYEAAEIQTVEIRAQVATAKQYPRNISKAISDAKALACINRNVAQSCIYFRPVGKRDGRMNFAEGGSIRLAEIIQSQWGNIRIGSRTLGVKEGKLLVQGVCHDLEKNVYVTSEVAKSVKKRDGSLFSDAMIEVVNMAGQSIARRNVVFSAIPKAFADDVLESVKDTIVGEDIQAAWAKAKQVFKEMGASSRLLLKVLDCKTEADVGKDEVVKLHGLHNVISDGVCSFDEVFGEAPKNEKKGGPTTEMAPDAPKQQGAVTREEQAPVAGVNPTELQRYNALGIKVAQKKGKKYLNDLIGVYENSTKLTFDKFDESTLKSLNSDLEKALA